MEKIQLKVDGMDCSNCALTIRKYLEKKGMQDVKVNFATGDVSFDANGNYKASDLATGIHDLGYEVAGEQTLATKGKRHFLSTHLQRFLFCLPFTAVLMLHMIPGLQLHWLMNPWLQLALTIPVFVVGMSFFGKSAWKSIRNGIPNMNVLIAIGALASFVYSLYGTLTGQAADYMFYETTATILTLVFLGNYMEDASVQSTQRALNKLVKSQKVMANMIAYDDQHQEQIFAVESDQLRT
ncbi:MAG: cation-translocating P-type ATPase, partial [Chitinophagaceae bacterium]